MRFNDIIGNEKAKKYLLNIIKNKNISQSYLFVGIDGIGKLLMAKEFAKSILCLKNKNDGCDCKSCKYFNSSNHPDYSVINEKGETIKIEEIRKLITKSIEPPIISDKKIYIINDADKMTIEAQNCLLKTLEEPPKFIILILITSNENALIDTIKSRCMTIKFNKIANDELKKYAEDKLGYNKITDNLLKSFEGSIGKAVLQKENQEKYIEIENFINNLEKQDITEVMSNAKFIYDKENIYMILEYMMICMYSKQFENKKYLNCVEKINNSILRLKCNCNFNMTIDTMLFEVFAELNRRD